MSVLVYHKQPLPKTTIDKQLFPSVDGGSADWASNWGPKRELTNAHEVDPVDNNCIMRGSGSIQMGNGAMEMLGTGARLYVKSPKVDHKWRNVEVTMFGELTDPSYSGSGSGFAIGARSNHDISGDGQPCQAHGYYGKLWTVEGKFGIAKEFYHSPTKLIYASSKKSALTLSQDTLEQKFVGMKVVIQDAANGLGVRLRVYGIWTGVTEWTLVEDYLDDGDWVASEPVPCTYSSYIIPGMSPDAAPVTRATTFVILRQSVPGIIWKSSSIREIDAL